ncbi:MAG: DinB family protein [Mucilaginibacter sp.]
MKLVQSLTNVLSGNAWYGPNIYSLLEQVSFEAAYEKPPGSAHNIAEIVLHMIAWTEEVMDRMNGLTPGIPSSGDWPPTGAPDEQKWQNYVNDLKLVNVNLQGIIQNFPPEKWGEIIPDEREPKVDFTYAELIEGLIQHYVYHSGQIALLLRIAQIFE